MTLRCIFNPDDICHRHRTPAVQRKSGYRCHCRGDYDRRLKMNINPIFDWFL
jgi:hypothetical protein